MPERKHINPREFKETGFLQEANRQFFHPHGLALELTTVTDEPLTVCAFTDAEVDELRALLDAERSRLEVAGAGETARAPVAAVLERLAAATPYQPGESWFSGCWDVRHDPEGVIFGDQPEDKRAKAERVLAERKRHYDARCDLFGVPADVRTAVVDADIEPLDWEYHPEENEAAHG